MKKLLLIILISFSGLCLTAHPNLDSLLSVWNDHDQNDSLRANAYRDYIRFGIFFSAPDSACILAEELSNWYRKIQK
jgi:adenylate cyclase